MLFYACEIMDDESYFLYVDPDEEFVDEAAENELSVVDHDRCVKGTVEAESINGAVDLIQQGKWVRHEGTD